MPLDRGAGVDSGGVVAGHPYGLGLALGLQLALKSMFAYGLPVLPRRVRWSDQLAQRAIPYLYHVWGALGCSEGSSHYRYTISTTDPTKDIPWYILSGAYAHQAALPVAVSPQTRAKREAVGSC